MVQILPPTLRHEHIHYFYKHAEPMTAQALLTRIDSQVLFYLRQVIADSHNDSLYIAQSRLFIAMFTEQFPFSYYLMKLDSQDPFLPRGDTPLSADNLVDVLYTIGCFGDRACDVYTSLIQELEMDNTFSRPAPLEIAGQRLFDNEHIAVAGMYILANFFHQHLASMYLLETKSPELIEEERQRAIIKSASSVLNDIVRVLIIITLDNPDYPHALPLNALIAVIKSLTNRDVDQLVQFNQAVDDNPPVEIETLSIIQCFDYYWGIVQQHFPGYCAPHEIHKLVVLDRDEPFFRIVPADNFIFDPSPKNTDFSGFPPEGYLRFHSNYDTSSGVQLKNASVFTFDGRKVWWGDFDSREAYVRTIKGPCYLVDEIQSYHRLPDFIKTASRFSAREAQNPYPSEELLCSSLSRDYRHLPGDYVRLIAKGKLVDGEYQPNPLL